MSEHPDVDPDLAIEDHGSSYLIDQAQRGVPGKLELVWREAAAGKLSVYDCEEWIRRVAEKVVHEILDAKKLSGHQRGSKALFALGLSGRQDKLQDQKDVLNIWTAFGEITDPGRKPTRREKLDFMRAHGHYPDDGEGDDENQMKRIDRLGEDKN